MGVACDGVHSVAPCQSPRPLDQSQSHRISMKWLVTLALAAVALMAATAEKVSDDLKACVNQGNSINKCMADTLEALRPTMKTGYPDLKLPPTDPMKIEHIDFKLEDQLVNVTTEFTGISLQGLSNYQLKDIDANRAAKTIRMKIHVDELLSQGQYKFCGVVFRVDLGCSEGPYTSQYTGVTVNGTSSLIKENGVLKVGEQQLYVDVQGIKIDMENLLEDRKTLKKTILNFVEKKENTPQFVRQFQGEISEKVGGVIRQFLDRSLARMDPALFV